MDEHLLEFGQIGGAKSRIPLARILLSPTGKLIIKSACVFGSGLIAILMFGDADRKSAVPQAQKAVWANRQAMLSPYAATTIPDSPTEPERQDPLSMIIAERDTLPSAETSPVTVPKPSSSPASKPSQIHESAPTGTPSAQTPQLATAEPPIKILRKPRLILTGNSIHYELTASKAGQAHHDIKAPVRQEIRHYELPKPITVTQAKASSPKAGARSASNVLHGARPKVASHQAPSRARALQGRRFIPYDASGNMLPQEATYSEPAVPPRPAIPAIPGSNNASGLNDKLNNYAGGFGGGPTSSSPDSQGSAQYGQRDTMPYANVRACYLQGGCGGWWKRTSADICKCACYATKAHCELREHGGPCEISDVQGKPQCPHR